MILEVLGPKKNNLTNQNNGFASKTNEQNQIQIQNGGISKICDVTIAYPEGNPLDLFQIVFGSRPPCVTHVHYRVFDVKDVSNLISY